MKFLNYFYAAHLPSIRRDYPIGESFTSRFKGMSRVEQRGLQNVRFSQCASVRMERAVLSHYVRETIVHWIGAQVLGAGTGAETRSAQQVALMRDFKATVLVGFGDYVKRLSEVARENGIEPNRDIRIRMISGFFGPDSNEARGAGARSTAHMELVIPAS